MNTAIDLPNLIGPDRVLDVRTIPCAVKHPLILKTFREMAVGQHFVLVNGHDPVPLFEQFSAEWPDTFIWEHLLKESGEVRVKIAKIRTLATDGQALNAGCPAAQ